jgi:hypothetical protein
MARYSTLQQIPAELRDDPGFDAVAYASLHVTSQGYHIVAGPELTWVQDRLPYEPPHRHWFLRLVLFWKPLPRPPEPPWLLRAVFELAEDGP